MTIEQSGAFVNIVEAHKQFDKRRFARAGRADNGDFLAGIGD